MKTFPIDKDKVRSETRQFIETNKTNPVFLFTQGKDDLLPNFLLLEDSFVETDIAPQGFLSGKTKLDELL